MAISHSTKSNIFRLLDKLPSQFGYFVYHKLQRLFSSYSYEREINAAENTFMVINGIVVKSGLSLKDKTVIEIGSGWLPLLPYFMLYKGRVKNVITYDLNKHYNKKNIRELNILFRKRSGIEVKSDNENKYNLPLGISYYPKTNLIYSQLEDADLIFSRFVLEHVTPEDIYLMHKKFKTQCKKGVVISHIISPGDHRAYGDRSLSLQDFLRYSKEEWNNIQTKFDYHNRLRLPEYLKIFNTLGYEILSVDYESPKKDSSNFNKFLKVPLHADFKEFTAEELTAGNIKIAMRV